MKYIKKFEEAEKIKKAGMEEVLAQLKPWFPNAHISDCTIYNNEKEGRAILCFGDCRIANNFYFAYENEYFELEDVFEEVGDYLKEIKIKPRSFDINKWKKGFVERHLDFCCLTDFGEIGSKERHLIIDDENNVNFTRWNGFFFKNKSEKFKFDRKEKIYLKTQEDCVEFERQFIIIKNYLKNVPELNKCEYTDE